ncbi:MAG: hypothetical protein WC560_04840 [Syntrophales bacterium]
MKTFLFLFACSIFIFGCGSQPVPEWKNVSFNNLESYKTNYLNGRVKIAELHFDKAIEEIKKSGDLEILSTAYLTKYAVSVAVLEDFDDGDYLRIESVQQNPGSRTYYNFLKGFFDKVDKGLLPSRYRDVLNAFRDGKEKDMEQAVISIEDPLSKLIAAGLLVRHYKYSEVILKAAADTASVNGWKNAHLAYLEKLQALYEAGKETGKAANIQKKIQLIRN